MGAQIIVSGGSRGVGLAVVKRLLADGYHVTTFARTITEPRQELAKTDDSLLRVMKADLAAPRTWRQLSAPFVRLEQYMVW